MSERRGLSLSTYLALGLRNLTRHGWRTGLTLASLVVAIGALTFLIAMQDGWLGSMRENFVLTLTGHLQVHAAGFEANQEIANHIREPRRVADLLDDDGEVAAWSFRVRAAGLASVAGASGAARIFGIDPAREAAVTRLASFVDEGSWLDPADRRGILLGVTLAENLDVRLGEKVVLMTQAPGGDLASEAFRVRGTLRSGNPGIDQVAVVLPLATAQAWLGMGEGVTDVVVRASHLEAADRIAAKLRAVLAPDAYEVMRWYDLDPLVQQTLELSAGITFIILAVVIAVVLAEIVNTMLMSFYERTREFGLMDALGTRRMQLFAMVMWESLVLVAIGAGAGYLCGALAAWYWGRVGIDLSGFAESLGTFYMDPIIRPRLTLDAAVTILVTIVITAVLSGIYPAWRATRLNPVEAMRRI